MKAPRSVGPSGSRRTPKAQSLEAPAPLVLPIDVPPVARIAPRLLRIAELETMIGLNPATIYRLIAAGKFPRQIKLTEKSVAWLESDILDWIHSRRADSQGGVR